MWVLTPINWTNSEAGISRCASAGRAPDERQIDVPRAAIHAAVCTAALKLLLRPSFTSDDAKTRKRIHTPQVTNHLSIAFGRASSHNSGNRNLGKSRSGRIRLIAVDLGDILSSTVYVNCDGWIAQREPNFQGGRMPHS